MIIYCHSLDHLITIVAGLVARGIGFAADTDTLRITLTGAH